MGLRSVHQLVGLVVQVVQFLVELPVLFEYQALERNILLRIFLSIKN
jgi:hypothetical protein